MLDIKDKDIFVNAIKAESLNLSDKMIDAVGFILAIIRPESSVDTKKAKAAIYAKNISTYISSSISKTYVAYDLILAALRNDLTEEEEGNIKALVSIKTGSIENKLPLPKVGKKQLIKS